MKHMRGPICDRGKPFLCFICGRKTLTKKSLDDHLGATHSGVDLANYRRCSKCGKSFQSHESLRNHFYMCTKKLRFFCKVCSHKAISKSSLKKHMYRNHICNENSDTGKENGIGKQMSSNTFDRMLRRNRLDASGTVVFLYFGVLHAKFTTNDIIYNSQMFGT